MKSELDEVLERIPQCEDLRDGMGTGADAKIYIDAAGRVCILIDNIGFLALSDHNTGYLVADVDPFGGQ